MPVDPHISPLLEDAPRQHQNLPPGMEYPAARAWRADRPGELGPVQPMGARLGTPGPNVGYGYTLANRLRSRFVLADHEHLDDAVAVVAEIAMKRAASLGRAPVVVDVEVAMAVVGYLEDASDEVTAWRPRAVRGAAHDYEHRRAIVDLVPEELLRRPPGEVAEGIPAVRAALRSAVASS